MEDVDQAATVSLQQQTEQQMFCLEKEDYKELLKVTQFFERVKEEDDTSKFQDVSIKCFEQVKEAAKHTKNTWVTAIKNVNTTRLGNTETVYN